MARAKRKSDETYNARRRAKRLLARLEREDTSGMSRTARAARESYIQSVREQIELSYMPKGGTAAARKQRMETVQANARKLDRMTNPVRGRKTKAQRSNQFFQRQITAARLGLPTVLGGRTQSYEQQELAKAEVNIFYAATRRFWQGKDATNRNQYIMEGMGVSSLEQAFNLVLSQNRDALRLARESARQTGGMVAGRTDENAPFNAETDIDGERMGSPDYLMVTALL